MPDDAFRRFLDGATAPMPAGLDAAVLERLRREPAARGRWRWTAVAAAVLVLAGVLAWQLGGRAEPPPRANRTGLPLVRPEPIGRTGVVLTWLPAGFVVDRTDERSTTWRGPGGSVTVGVDPEITPAPDTRPEWLAPMINADRVDGAGTERLAWKSDGGLTVVDATGLSEAEVLRVALGVVAADRLRPIEPGQHDAPVPVATGDDYRFASSRLGEAGFRVRWVIGGTDDDAAGQVMGQRPRAGTSAPVGSLVTLVVAGPRLPATAPGDRPSVAGGMGVAARGDGTAGYVPNRLLLEAPSGPGAAEPPKPVTFLHGELVGWLFAGARGFVPVDELLEPQEVGDSGATTTVVDRTTTTTASLAEWSSADRGSITVRWPPTWGLSSGGCPADRTVTLLDGRGKRPRPAGSCPDDDQASWIVVEPLPDDLGDIPDDCMTGFIDGAAMCQHVGGRMERVLYDGQDALVTLHHGDRHIEELNAIQGALVLHAPVPAPPPQTASVARQAVVDLLAGRCEALPLEASACRALRPPAGSEITDQLGIAVSRTVHTFAIRVRRADGSFAAFEVRVGLRWSREELGAVAWVRRLTVLDEPWPPSIYAPEG